jgi:ATP-dependent RNA helicase DHX57
MGAILGCRDAAVAMAAGLSIGKSPFVRIERPREYAKSEKSSIDDFKQRILEEREKIFKSVGNSDHAILAALFLKWYSLPQGAERTRFCESLGLSFTGMRDMLQVYSQLNSSLVTAGFNATMDSNRNGQSWRIIHSCAVAAMSPGQLVKVRKPALKYAETAEGAQEKDGEARELKFFVRIDGSVNDSGRENEEMVFIHPSSANFSNGNYSCPYLVFNSMVRTSKPFLRDVTECSAYSLLLFGGELDVRASKSVIMVDGWAELSANARIGSLVAGLRTRVDALLERKVADPSFEIAASDEMLLIVKLIVTDGLGT